MTQQLRAFFAAVMFLTRIPVPAWIGHDDELLPRSTPYFPVVGIVVGALGGGVYLLARMVWPATIAAVLAVIATVWVTGAFHEDALADAFDGFGGGWTTERVLEIMKDSRIGSYGAIALILVTLGRVTTIAALGDSLVLRAMIAAHVLGRWSSLPLIWHCRYVRDQSATSKPFAAGVNGFRLAIGTVIAIIAVGLALGISAWLPIVVAVALTAMAGAYFTHRIGGITGDCLGAANQAVEFGVYLALAAHR